MLTRNRSLQEKWVLLKVNKANETFISLHKKYRCKYLIREDQAHALFQIQKQYPLSYYGKKTANLLRIEIKLYCD